MTKGDLFTRPEFIGSEADLFLMPYGQNDDGLRDIAVTDYTATVTKTDGSVSELIIHAFNELARIRLLFQ